MENTEELKPEVSHTEETKTTPTHTEESHSTQTEAGGNGFVNVMKKVFGAIWRFIVLVTKTIAKILMAFIKDMTFKSKIVFLVLMLIVVFFTFIIAYNLGQDNIVGNLDTFGVSYEKLERTYNNKN